MSRTRDPTLESLKERAWRRVADVDDALSRGEIDEEGWHRAMAELCVPAYLAAPTPSGGSGHSGTEEDWEHSRGLVAEALHRDGAFLDVGCANGLLMESIERWGREHGLSMEAHGVDISPELAARARERLPQWADRIHVANAHGWTPPRRFEFVRTGLEYAPAHRRRELVSWLLDEVVAPGGRLIVGKVNEERDEPGIVALLDRWGFAPVGYAERAHRDPRIAYCIAWIDAPTWPDDLRFRAFRREDLPLMQRWLREPHVDEWWHSRKDVVTKYVPRIEGRQPCHDFVLELRDRPVGFFQWYRWRDYSEHGSRIGVPPHATGVDMFLGELDCIGQGIGSRALDLFVRTFALRDPSIRHVVSDPEAANARSLGAFRRAGFRVERELQLDDGFGPHAIVVRDR